MTIQYTKDHIVNINIEKMDVKYNVIDFSKVLNQLMKDKNEFVNINIHATIVNPNCGDVVSVK